MHELRGATLRPCQTRLYFRISPAALMHSRASVNASWGFAVMRPSRDNAILAQGANPAATLHESGGDLSGKEANDIVSPDHVTRFLSAIQRGLSPAHS